MKWYYLRLEDGFVCQDIECSDGFIIKPFVDDNGHVVCHVPEKNYKNFPFPSQVLAINGGGTILRRIEKLAGDNFSVDGIDTRDFREKFYMSRLDKGRLVNTNETHNKLANIAHLEQITGESITELMSAKVISSDGNIAEKNVIDTRDWVDKYYNIAKYVLGINELPLENGVPKIPFDMVIEKLKELQETRQNEQIND